MKLWIRILLSLLILGIISAALIWHFIINKPAPDYDKLKADYTINANQLFEEFMSKRKNSENKYNGKIVQIKGKFKTIEQNDSLSVVVFSFGHNLFGEKGIRCTLLPKYKSEIKKHIPETEISIKGYCSGFNDVDVILTKCSIK
ncbi:MAG: hypothetical protein Q8880_04385 [Bacteroidota bacterium]|nr:hypothetical protein [Bacteroidota bacterium]